MNTATLSIFAFYLICQFGIAAEPATLPHDTYSGYFVSNKFEPDAAQSFVTAPCDFPDATLPCPWDADFDANELFHRTQPA